MSGLAGEAFVAIWHDIAPEGLAAFYDWHTREHMPERLGIQGFRRGRRYLRESGDGQAFFNLYEVDRFEVLVGQDYLGRLDAPTPWTARTVRHFRHVTRGLCRVAGSEGFGQGGAIATLRLAPAPGRDAGLRAYLLRDALPRLLDSAGILGAHLGITDDRGSRIETAEKQARRSATDIPAWVMLIEGISAARIAEAMAGPLSAPALTAHGAQTSAIQALYRLEATRLKTA